MGIINESFMLYSETAKKLYHAYAEHMPIIDYHCHLSPKMIAEDYVFENVGELFLGGDHYKWRQMRSCGIPETHITGDAPYEEKWRAFARCMPRLIGNPIYHWTALELKRYFDVDLPLNEKNAEEIWNICNAQLASGEFSARKLILRSGVEVLCTTDDPADDLAYHKAVREDGFPVKVLPTFRPDRAIGIQKPDFPGYLAEAGVNTFAALSAWLEARVEYFHQAGCRLSDHSLEAVPCRIGDADAVLARRLSGAPLTTEEIEIYQTAVYGVLARAYAAHGWTMQLHIGALRNNNTAMHHAIGADSGFDSMNDLCIAEKLSGLLDMMEREDHLPKTILYCLNPKDNYVLGTMIGNFQKGPVRGKIQFGSGWWFNDNRDGMEEQIRALANLGALGNFVGMLTDSRSFVSYPRHEYFRRILCNVIGEWVERGEYPYEEDALREVIEGICYRNAKEYFDF